MLLRFSRKPDKKLLRHTTQAVTGRTLDYLNVFDKNTRAAVNREMHKLISEESVLSDKKDANEKIKSVLGEEKASEFYSAFEQIFLHNREIIEYLSQQMAENEIKYKTMMN